MSGYKRTQIPERGAGPPTWREEWLYETPTMAALLLATHGGKETISTSMLRKHAVERQHYREQLNERMQAMQTAAEREAQRSERHRCASSQAFGGGGGTVSAPNEAVGQPEHEPAPARTVGATGALPAAARARARGARPASAGSSSRPRMGASSSAPVVANYPMTRRHELQALMYDVKAAERAARGVSEHDDSGGATAGRPPIRMAETGTCSTPRGVLRKEGDGGARADQPLGQRGRVTFAPPPSPETRPQSAGGAAAASSATDLAPHRVSYYVPSREERPRPSQGEDSVQWSWEQPRTWQTSPSVTVPAAARIQRPSSARPRLGSGRSRAAQAPRAVPVSMVLGQVPPVPSIRTQFF